MNKQKTAAEILKCSGEAEVYETPMETRCTLQSPSLRLSLQGNEEWRELRGGNVADFFFRWTQLFRKKGSCS